MSGASATGGRPQKDQLADAYIALGITADAKPAEIKRAYRKLISQNHPDKLAARGLPESMRPIAEERSRELNSAYDIIKRALLPHDVNYGIAIVFAYVYDRRNAGLCETCQSVHGRTDADSKGNS